MREDVGKCIQQGDDWEIEKAWYGQGMVFKSWEAYENRPDDPCYVPELSDNVYTANGILELCNGQKDKADELFEQLDWAHPESQKEDLYMNGEWATCPKCGIVDLAGEESDICPICGERLED